MDRKRGWHCPQVPREQKLEGQIYEDTMRLVWGQGCRPGQGAWPPRQGGQWVCVREVPTASRSAQRFLMRKRAGGSCLEPCQVAGHPQMLLSGWTAIQLGSRCWCLNSGTDVGSWTLVSGSLHCLWDQARQLRGSVLGHRTPSPFHIRLFSLASQRWPRISADHRSPAGLTAGAPHQR